MTTIRFSRPRLPGLRIVWAGPVKPRATRPKAPPQETTRAAASKAPNPAPRPNSCPAPSVASTAKPLSLSNALAILDAADRSKLSSLIFDLAAKVLPGKRVARLDLLQEKAGTVISSFWCSLREHQNTRFFNDIEVTAVFQCPWHELAIPEDLKPDHLASMQAMNQRKGVNLTDGDERFFALPLLGPEKKVLGAIVLSDQTAEGRSNISPENEETFRSLAKIVSKRLA